MLEKLLIEADVLEINELGTNTRRKSYMHACVEVKTVWCESLVLIGKQTCVYTHHETLAMPAPW